ncbi:DUF1254 domain-containing protein [Methanofollis formosanus]|uniref:DUF1254 domain-containing protein n=1 Tax=Methanofollis formosanus TaxID=299308 RepID=A0A8G0ZWT2_9EURY|nr:DUF1254 domain-containing protein [Methanofollis formosanus]QYZ78154.1 DUF1254 domain-containing protein [Methanofollis formosanus]
MRAVLAEERRYEELVDLAGEAYLYGYPLTECVRTMMKMARGVEGGMGAPVNTFWHADRLLDPAFRQVVSPNNDTLYSVAVVDLGPEPMVLHVPDTQGRYYVMQCVDAWTNNFAYIGRRGTGTEEGAYALVGPGWEGSLPEGMTMVRAPTDLVGIIGRTAVNGPGDVPAVRALQQQYTLAPLRAWPGPARDAGERRPGDWPLPAPRPGVRADLLVWEEMRVWMQAYPPPAGEREFLDRFAPLGLTDPKSPYLDPEPEIAAALTMGRMAAEKAIRAYIRTSLPKINGWLYTTHLWDYNTRFFEVGTVQEESWTTEDFMRRAAAARAGLFGNHGYEAAYPWTYEDVTGELLTGERRYLLHFDRLPPVGAFWSVTMYSSPDYMLVENPLGRYSIGDRTPGLKYHDDGSLDIYIQHDSPGPEKESNWLPAPEEAFRPIMRMYQPDRAVLDGSYLLPPIRRVG